MVKIIKSIFPPGVVGKFIKSFLLWHAEAAGFFIFYFWLCNGKNYKMYFSSRKELDNLFLKN